MCLCVILKLYCNFAVHTPSVFSTCESREQEKKWQKLKQVQKEHYCFYMQKSKKKKKKKDTHVDEESEDYEFGEERIKPIPPKMASTLEIEQQVREKADNCRRKPGEPVLVPELTLSGNVTPTEQCPR